MLGSRGVKLAGNGLDRGQHSLQGSNFFAIPPGGFLAFLQERLGTQKIPRGEERRRERDFGDEKTLYQVVFTQFNPSNTPMFLTLRASSSRAQLHVDLLHVLPISRSSSAWDTRFDPSVRSRTFSQSTKVSRADLSVAIHAEADQRIELARERPKSTVDRRLRIPVNAAKSTKVSTKGRTSIKARRVERSAPKVKRKQQASFGPSKDGHASRVDESALRKWGIRQVNSNSEVDKVEALPRDERNGGEGGTAEVKSEELEGELELGLTGPTLMSDRALTVQKLYGMKIRSRRIRRSHHRASS